MAHTTTTLTNDGAVAHLTMNRPDKHNAFDPALIEELQQAFVKLGEDSKVRIIVLAGEGASFSAGADLDWMKGLGDASEQRNLESAREMAALFISIDQCPKPVVAKVQGAALGGGSGLVCSVDIAIAGPKALFGFTEVRLGIVAAVISPFAIRRLGYSESRAKMLTGERFDATEALRIGMVHEVAEDLDAAVAKTVKQLLKGSPAAQSATKSLLAQIHDLPYDQQTEPTARAIATARASDDGKDGLTAFLEKRPARWV